MSKDYLASPAHLYLSCSYCGIPVLLDSVSFDATTNADSSHDVHMTIEGDSYYRHTIACVKRVVFGR